MRLDDTDLPGLNETVGYVDARHNDIATICQLVLSKLGASGLVLHEAPVEAHSGNEGPELLDLRVVVDSAFSDSMKALMEIVELSADHSKRTRAWMERAQHLHAARGTPQQAFALVNEQAAGFERQTRALAPLVKQYEQHTRVFFDALERLIEFQLQAGLSSLDDMRAGIASYAKVDSVAKETRDAYASSAEVLAGLTTPTKEFRRRRSQLATQIDAFVVAVDYWLSRSLELRRKFGISDGNRESYTDAP